MVIGVFPAAKLGVLAIKQISKPIANVLKSNAKSSPFFRKYICMPPAQFYNWVEVKTKMWALNLGRPVTVPPLNEAMAIELGANLLGEFIIFAIGAGLLIFEYSRQTIKENKKNEALQFEKMQLTNTLTEMNFRLERQDAQIREMTRVLADLDSRNIFSWHKEPLQEYVTFDPNTPDQSASARNAKTYEGFYDPTGGMAFRALNFLQTQIFVDGRDRKAKHQVDAVAVEVDRAFDESLSKPQVEAPATRSP
ncbi:putative OPA3-like protein CG13603 [Drosophila sulfurigaster albostrigata]|uniref:putative OPA3-like protein CG13603 n=1 Tax=Drosophila sulfurigaster albostrigata TaxID=89887 RepID=UPI002D21A856|nr:putative OPA3-like protein CG13603 [Drosophila sulfurigaster albostrigata]